MLYNTHSETFCYVKAASISRSSLHHAPSIHRRLKAYFDGFQNRKNHNINTTHFIKADKEFEDNIQKIMSFWNTICILTIMGVRNTTKEEREKERI